MSKEVTFEHEASLQELAGVGKNERFDELVDSEEDDSIQVICKRGDDEIPLAKPARAFYFGDRNLYDQEVRRYTQEQRQRILNTDQFRGNQQVFDELKRACLRGFVIPFVGAGMSRSAGLPEWKDYLLQLCRDAGLDFDTMKERIESKDDYEGVMNEVVARLTIERFERDFERDFKNPDQIDGAVRILPKLFDSSVVTTNFDRVLERVYELEGTAFIEKVTGRGSANSFFRALPAGERYLLKLHGNLDNASERVLNRDEYDTAYGVDGNIHFDYPLPKLLRRLFTSYSFLFLGCSLSADRTIQTFMKVAQQDGADSLPHHYAILPCPDDNDKKRAIDERLAVAHISPLWFPDGEFQLIEEILQLLAE